MGRRLLYLALEMEYGVSKENVSLYKNSYGKPMILERPDISFNISHCKDMVVCGVAKKNFGVDIENIRSFNFRVAERVCSEYELFSIRNSQEPEKIFFQYWTLKESLGKAMGVGLNYPLKDVSFRINNDGVQCSMDMFDFYLYEVNSAYLMAVCIEKGESPMSGEK